MSSVVYVALLAGLLVRAGVFLSEGGAARAPPFSVSPPVSIS